jgi:hypothetical protein
MLSNKISRHQAFQVMLVIQILINIFLSSLNALLIIPSIINFVVLAYDFFVVSEFLEPLQKEIFSPTVDHKDLEDLENMILKNNVKKQKYK